MNYAPFRLLIGAASVLVPAVSSAATAAPETPPDYRYKVDVVFVNPGKSSLMNLDWLQFNPR